MNLAAIATQIGPFLVDQYVTSQVENAKARGVSDLDELAQIEHNARELAIVVSSSVQDALMVTERTKDTHGKAHFVAHIAADLIRGWHGEPTHEAAREAAAIAKTLVDEAERLCTPPARSASAPKA